MLRPSPPSRAKAQTSAVPPRLALVSQARTCMNTQPPAHPCAALPYTAAHRAGAGFLITVELRRTHRSRLQGGMLATRAASLSALGLLS
jgi:hypothetical protein